MNVRQSRIPAWFGAQAIAVSPSLVLILPERLSDLALIAHEEKHASQQKDFGWFRWWVKYLCSREFRLEMEVEAYATQIRHGASLDACARNLSSLYRLGISQVLARQILLDELFKQPAS